MVRTSGAVPVALVLTAAIEAGAPLVIAVVVVPIVPTVELAIGVMVVVWLGLPPLNALTVNKYGAKLSTAVAPELPLEVAGKHERQVPLLSGLVKPVPVNAIPELSSLPSYFKLNRPTPQLLPSPVSVPWQAFAPAGPVMVQSDCGVPAVAVVQAIEYGAPALVNRRFQIVDSRHGAAGRSTSANSAGSNGVDAATGD